MRRHADTALGVVAVGDHLLVREYSIRGNGGGSTSLRGRETRRFPVAEDPSDFVKNNADLKNALCRTNNALLRLDRFFLKTQVGVRRVTG